MEKNNIEKIAQFYKIIQEKRIYPVYQPIVSLKNGEIIGYEALTRIDLESTDIETEEFFHMAEDEGCLWTVEEMCRFKSLEESKDKEPGKKLFLNVDPNVIKDPMFRKGITRAFLKEFGLYPEDIVFEITERNSIEDQESFQGIIQHYKAQNFEIAIDDFGNGYAGLNRICSLEPQYIKIDREIVNGIQADAIKKSLAESMVSFCKKSDIKLIAEGIETEEELVTLIGMGVDFGQGFYLKRPARKMEAIYEGMVQKIVSEYEETVVFNPNRKIFGAVEEICNPGEVFRIGERAEKAYSYMCNYTNLTEMIVVDEANEIKGILTRSDIFQAFGGMYGYGVSMKKNVEELMNTAPLTVDAADCIDEVSRKALMRTQKHIYDAVVVTKMGKYYGVVTVKNLLEAAISIQVHRAVETNPLTGLPGNSLINEKIKELIRTQQSFSIAYIDMDNFKAYNDAYGFSNGDKMIRMLAECMKRNCLGGEFLGHVGGDDFVIIKKGGDMIPLLGAIADDFANNIQSLYKKEDRERGYIVSRNRRGEIEKFQIVTISIGVISVKESTRLDMDAFSKLIARAKKGSKQIMGNSYYCCDSIGNVLSEKSISA